MAPPLDKDLVQLIIWLAQQRGEQLTTLRLVKLLYLADLYWAREHEGLTLTGGPWAFVHFGPFAGEALDIRSSKPLGRASCGPDRTPARSTELLGGPGEG